MLNDATVFNKWKYKSRVVFSWQGCIQRAKSLRKGEVMRKEMEDHLQNQPLTCSAKRLQLLIPALMEDSRFLAELLKTAFLHWFDTFPSIFADLFEQGLRFSFLDFRLLGDEFRYCRIISSRGPLKNLLQRTCMEWNGNFVISIEVVQTE